MIKREEFATAWNEYINGLNRMESTIDDIEDSKKLQKIIKQLRKLALKVSNNLVDYEHQITL